MERHFHAVLNFQFVISSPTSFVFSPFLQYRLKCRFAIELSTSTLYPIHNVEDSALGKITLNTSKDSIPVPRKGTNAPNIGPFVLVASDQDQRDFWAENLLNAMTLSPDSLPVENSKYFNADTSTSPINTIFQENSDQCGSLPSSFDYIFRQAMLSGLSLPKRVFPADSSAFLSSCIETLVSNQKISYLAREKPLLYCYTGQKEFFAGTVRFFRRIPADALSRCVILTNRRFISVRGTSVQVDYEYTSLAKLIFISSRKVLSYLHATSTLLERIIAEDLSYETQPLWLRTLRTTTNIPGNFLNFLKFNKNDDIGQVSSGNQSIENRTAGNDGELVRHVVSNCFYVYFFFCVYFVVTVGSFLFVILFTFFFFFFSVLLSRIRL